MKPLTVADLNARFGEGWRSAGLEKICPRCEESRMVIATTIHGRTDYFCEVCSFAWVPPGEECV